MFDKAGEERSFLKKLQRRRVQLIEHTWRHDSLIKTVTERKIEGKNCKERPHLEVMNQVMQGMNIDLYHELKGIF